MELYKFYLKVSQDTLNNLRYKLMTPDPELEAHLQHRLDAEFEKLEIQNKAIALDKFSKFFEEGYLWMLKQLLNPDYAIPNFLNDWDFLIKNFIASTKGPGKADALAQFQADKMKLILIELNSRGIQKVQNAINSSKKREEQYQKELYRKQEEIKGIMESKHRSDLAAQQEVNNFSILKLQFTALEAQYQNKILQLNTDYKKIIGDLKEKYDTDISKATNIIKTESTKANELENQVNEVLNKNVDLISIKTQFDESEKLHELQLDHVRQEAKKADINRKEIRSALYQFLVTPDSKDQSTMLPNIQKLCNFTPEEMKLIQKAQKKRIQGNSWLPLLTLGFITDA